jgi:hypothetical protein
VINIQQEINIAYFIDYSLIFTALSGRFLLADKGPVDDTAGQKA